MAIERMERHASDNEYFHRDFHISSDRGVRYVGEKFGDDAVCAYLTQFARVYYAPLIARAKAEGLPAIREHIVHTYQIEKAEDAVRCTLSDTALLVEIQYCPAVRYMKKSGYEPSPWYVELTSTVYAVIAAESGLGFAMLAYDSETGAAAYRFTR